MREMKVGNMQGANIACTTTCCGPELLCGASQAHMRTCSGRVEASVSRQSSLCTVCSTLTAAAEHTRAQCSYNLFASWRICKQTESTALLLPLHRAGLPPPGYPWITCCNRHPTSCEWFQGVFASAAAALGPRWHARVLLV